MRLESAIAFHGYGSSPSKIAWLVNALKRTGLRVEAPKLPQPLVKAYEYVMRIDLDFDVFAGHSMGGALALILSSKRKKPAIAVAPPTDLSYQFEHMRKSERLRRIYEEIVKSVDESEMTALSPVNFEYSQPILIIHGTRDSVVPIEESKKFCNRFPSCKLVEIPGMGHAPAKDAELKEINEAIANFVNDLRKLN